MAEVKLASGQPCQNLGASQTYLKRYLYQHCFEIVENDILDASIVCEESEVDNLIAQVKERMNTFNDEQLDYANKAIAERDFKKLKIFVTSKK